MNSTGVYLARITDGIIYIVPFILLIVGTLGCLGNLITFTSRQLNKNSCAFYFLSTAIFELFTLSFGLISRIADQYGSVLQKQSRIYCKIRYYFALTFPTIATELLLMAAIDRCMSTSISVRCRRFSQLKIAYRMVPLVVILSMIACSHTLIFVDHRPLCLPQSGLYSLFYSIFLMGFCSLLPNGLLLVFGLKTIRNVKRVRHQKKGLHYQQRIHRTNNQFVIMILTQGIISSVIDITRLTCYSYYLLTANHSKSSYQQIVDKFIFQFSIALSYCHYSESFYTNTLTSTLFRNVFRQTCQLYYQKLTGTHRKQSKNTVLLNSTSDHKNHGTD